jgi:hypothetical protein
MDILIGHASGYSWDQIKYWVRSIKSTSFDGDIALTVTNISGDTVRKLQDEGVLVYGYGTPNEDGGFTNSNQAAPHVERFFYIWLVLDKMTKKYDNVITTDVRDVVFNRNPSLNNKGKINISCEFLSFRNEPWGFKNMFDAYGPFFREKMKDNLIYNVGVISGDFYNVKGMLLEIFLMSINRPTPIADQASFNILVSETYPKELFDDSNLDWAIQIGTTPRAVLEGIKGDLAAYVRNGLIDKNDYRRSYFGPDSDSETLKKFAIWHQWDRVPELEEEVRRRWGD